MKKKLTAVLLAALMLSGCTAKPEQTLPRQTETAESTDSSEATFMTIPDQIVTPDEMPQPPEEDAQLPPQPGQDVKTE